MESGQKIRDMDKKKQKVAGNCNKAMRTKRAFK